MTVKPLGDRVLIKMKEVETKTASGLYIPQTAQEKTTTGTVVAIGDDKDIITVMSEESKITPTFLKVDGGASRNNFLMQFQSDILDIEILRPRISETTALGAAYISGLATGFYKNIEEIQKLNSLDKSFTSKMSLEKRTNLYSNWVKAVEATRKFK